METFYKVEGLAIVIILFIGFFGNITLLRDAGIGGAIGFITGMIFIHYHIFPFKN